MDSHRMLPEIHPSIHPYPGGLVMWCTMSSNSFWPKGAFSVLWAPSLHCRAQQVYSSSNCDNLFLPSSFSSYQDQWRSVFNWEVTVLAQFPLQFCSATFAKTSGCCTPANMQIYKHTHTVVCSTESSVMANGLPTQGKWNGKMLCFILFVKPGADSGSVLTLLETEFTFILNLVTCDLI